MSSPFKIPADFIAGATAAPVDNKPKATPSPAKEKPAKAVKTTSYPWEDKDPRIIQNFQLRLPSDLHAALKYFGDTTAGESMHSLILKTAFELAERLKKERGVK